MIILEHAGYLLLSHLKICRILIYFILNWARKFTQIAE